MSILELFLFILDSPSPFSCLSNLHSCPFRFSSFSSHSDSCTIISLRFLSQNCAIVLRFLSSSMSLFDCSGLSRPFPWLHLSLRNICTVILLFFRRLLCILIVHCVHDYSTTSSFAPADSTLDADIHFRNSQVFHHHTQHPFLHFVSIK